MLITGQVEKRIDPRIKRTRKLINQAFLDLMNEKGFQSLTIQDITDRAEINRATFYAHYEDKYDLLDSYIREGFLDWLSQKNPSASPLDNEHLTRLVESIFDFQVEMNAHCGHMEKQLRPTFVTAIQDELAKYLSAWIGRTTPGSPMAHPDDETVALVWSWAILGASMQWSRGPRAMTTHEMAAQVVEVLLSPPIRVGG